MFVVGKVCAVIYVATVCSGCGGGSSRRNQLISDKDRGLLFGEAAVDKNDKSPRGSNSEDSSESYVDKPPNTLNTILHGGERAQGRRTSLDTPQGNSDDEVPDNARDRLFGNK